MQRRGFLIVAVAVIFQTTTVRAEHASDNPVTSAEDAYGLTLGLESIGLYSPGLVRGFSPQAAGNVRIDGLYFDQQGGLSNRVVEGSTIRVGVSEIGYAFPAPTGIVDYDLRHPGGDTPSATIIANAGPYEAWGVSIDGSVPLIGKELVLPIGAGFQIGTGTPYGNYPGYTSSTASIGATPQWKPNENITVRALFDLQDTWNAKTFPIFFTAGDFLPPSIPKGYLGQNWAQGRNVTMNIGGSVVAQLSDSWSLRAGIFRSTNDNPKSFADLYTDIQPNRRSEHLVVGFPDQITSSTSGEARLLGSFTAGDWHQEIIFMARDRDTPARYGGEDVVDVGPATIGAVVQVPEPNFVFSPRTIDHAELWSIGSAYHVDLRSRAQLEIGVQEENYHETAHTPGTPESQAAAQPVRLYGNSAVVLNDEFTLYGGYTEGLENSGTAPNSAQNAGALLPASLTWQIDSGVRYVVTPQLKVVAGAFELQKPYFNLDRNNVDRQLGSQRAKGIELSIAGQPIANLDINVGILIGKVGISGSDLAAEGVGRIAVGQPHLSLAANANYDFPWWQAASLDLSVLHFSSSPESVDNRIYAPAITVVNVGGRYRFAVLGENSSLRLQIQNVLASSWWASLYTPGFFRSPPPRTVFAYLTTDLQG